MNNYPSQTLSSTYSYSLMRQYASQPNYYPYGEYPSSSLLSPVSYMSLPRNQHPPSSSKYDDEEAYFSEYYRQIRYSRHANLWQYPNNHKSNRTHYISSQPQSKKSSVLSDNSCFPPAINQDNVDYQKKNSTIDNEVNEQVVLRRDPKRTTLNSPYKALTPAEFLRKTQAEIRQEYRKLPNPPAKDPHAAKDARNQAKNRYRDVLPGEATRVRLQPDDDDKSDYINANYVSGHNNQEKAYIFTQGPLENTVIDFWRMVWQESVTIIVMTTSVREAGAVKCFQYWPTPTNELVYAGLYHIQFEKLEKFDSFVVTTLTLRRENHPDKRTIYHAQYLKWPDHGVPTNTKDALMFLDQIEKYRQTTGTKAPVLLHCSAGIGRTGTFCAIDIGIKRYLEKNIIDVPSTVLKMRTERSGSVQTEDQYVFAYSALMDYIKQQQALQERITEPAKVSAMDIIDKSDGIKIKDDSPLNELDDQSRKGTRSKTNRKKSHELEQANNLSTNQFTLLTRIEEAPTYRGKTFSESSVSTAQNSAVLTAVPQSEPTRQRSVTENILAMPPTTGNVHHKKARK